MPDESLRSTAGVATQAAEVSHSIAVANRTSLAYMKPTTYMTHKMVQVAMMNIRKLQRLSSTNATGENDHIPLAPFFHSHLSRGCQRGSSCLCQASIEDTGTRETETALRNKIVVEGGDTLDNSVEDSNEGGAEDGAGADGGVQEHPGETETVVLDDAGAGDNNTTPGNTDHDVANAVRHGGSRVLLAPLSTLPLSDADAAGVESLVSGRAPVAPVRAVNKGKIVLTVADFRRFEADKWLNDEVMNSLVALINHRAKQVACMLAAGLRAAAGIPRTFMFNTFFFARLCERAGCYDYDGVRTWGFKNGLDVGSVDRILIPVNVENLHWVLVIVDVKERRFLFFDSLGGRAASVLGMVRRWLTDEVVNRLGVDTAESWNINSWDGLVDVGLPRQRDGGSCGVFVLAAADCFALGVPLCFSQADMPVLRQRMSLALLEESLTVEDAAASLPVDVDCSMVDE